MTDTNHQQDAVELLEVDFLHPEWNEPIICRVEVDLPNWLSQLAGGRAWEVYAEDEEAKLN